MGVFPLAAALLAGAFTVALIRQYMARRRPYQALWAVSLAMYAIASFALFVGVSVGWNPLLFRAYWLFGAVLTVPYLAGGEVVLLAKGRWALRAVMGVLAVTTVAGFVVVLGAPVSPVAIGGAFPRGADAFGDGSPASMLARLYSYVGYAVLVVGALWSAMSMRGEPALRDRFWGTLFIVVGATVVAAGSAFAAGGVLIGFSFTLAAGIALMFLGFLKASTKPAAVHETALGGEDQRGPADGALRG